MFKKYSVSKIVRINCSSNLKSFAKSWHSARISKNEQYFSQQVRTIFEKKIPFKNFKNKVDLVPAYYFNDNFPPETSP